MGNVLTGYDQMILAQEGMSNNTKGYLIPTGLFLVFIGIAALFYYLKDQEDCDEECQSPYNWGAGLSAVAALICLFSAIIVMNFNRFSSLMSGIKTGNGWQAFGALQGLTK
jgi:hypothetical protein